MKQNIPVFAMVFAASVLAAMAGFVATYWVFGGFDSISEIRSEAPKPEAAGKSGSGLEKLVIHSEPRSLPDIKFTDAAGKERRLSEWRGRMALVNLWATWCAPCKAEMPSLDRLQAKLGGEDFTVIALSLDRGGAEKPRQFFEENAIGNLEIFLADIGEAGRNLKISGVPTSVLIDREGREIARLAGVAEWDKSDVMERLSGLIQRGRS